MTSEKSSKDVYLKCCQRWECRPNKGLLQYLETNADPLTSIDLSNDYIGDLGFYPLIDLVKQSPCIVELDLSSCCLKDTEFEYLLTSLEDHPTLSRLRLQNNRITSESIPSIKSYLSGNRKVETFQLAGNDLPQDYIMEVRVLVTRRKSNNISYRRLKRTAAAEQEAPSGISDLSSILEEGEAPPGEEEEEAEEEGASLTNTLNAEYSSRVRAAMGALASDKFRDSDFPPAPSSLFLDFNDSTNVVPPSASWKRVSTIVSTDLLTCDSSNPSAATEDVSADPDYAWFTNVVEALRARPTWLQSSFVNYNPVKGCASFQFFKNLEWCDVLIDDFIFVDDTPLSWPGGHRLPQNVYFLLLEKAYAKVHGCYEAIHQDAIEGVTVPDRMASCLTDLTGCVPRVLDLTEMKKGVEEEAQEMRRTSWWTLVQSNVNKADTFFCFTNQNGDVLYGLNGVYEMEGERIVKVVGRTCPENSLFHTCRLKYTLGGPRWSPSVAAYLHYDEEVDVHALYLTEFEVLKHFSILFHCVVYPCRTVYECPFTPSEETGVPLLLEPISVPEVSLAVGVHQRDPQLLPGRPLAPKVLYRDAIGLRVALFDHIGELCAEDLSSSLDNKTIMATRLPQRTRDSIAILPPSVLSNPKKVLTVVPMGKVMRSTSVLVSVQSDKEIDLTPVPQAQSCLVEGQWTLSGPPGTMGWRHNPQYTLTSTGTTSLTIRVAVSEGAPSCRMGFTLHRTNQLRRLLFFDEKSLLLHHRAPPSAAGEERYCEATVVVDGASSQLGYPSVVIPYCITETTAAALPSPIPFTLSVRANRKVHLSPMTAHFDWKQKQFEVEISEARRNNGGGPRYPTWRFSPQYLLHFPVEQEGDVLLSVANTNSASPHPITVMVIQTDSVNDIVDKRRRMRFSPDWVVASGEGTSPVEVFFTVTPDLLHRPLLLLVSLSDPYREGHLSTTIYAVPEVAVSPVKEWEHSAVVEGAWRVGRSAGGSRSSSPNWINNPLFSLFTSTTPTQVVCVLVYYPYNYITKRLKRSGAKTAPLATPATYPYLDTSLELEVVRLDPSLTSIAATVADRGRCDVTLWTALEESGERPYIVVPCTTQAQRNGFFKLFAYSDYPVLLESIPSERLSYV